MGAAMRYQPQGRIRFATGLAKRPCAAFVAGPVGPVIIGDGKHDPAGRSTGPTVVAALGPSGYATKTLSSSADTFRLNALANQLDTVWERPTAQVTVMLVFRRSGASAGVTPLFGNQCPNNTPYTAWCLEDQPSGLARFEIALGGANADPTLLTSSVALPNGQRIVLIGRYDGARMDLWLNGARVGQQAATGSITYPNAPDRGPSVNNYYNFGGLRSAQIEAYSGALWDVAISDAEIARYSTNPWALFDAGSSSSAYQAAIVGSASTSAGPKSFAYSTIGGVVFSGSAARVRGISRVPAGALTMAGSGQVVRGAARVTQGGVLLSGAAQTSFHASVQSRVVSAAGGLLIRGAAVLVRAWRRLASGGISWGGTSTAVETASTPPAVASFCLSTLMRANAVYAQATISNAAINRTANLL